MKKFSKIVSLLLALVMVLSMTTVAFAESTGTATGSITINGIATDTATNGTVYSIYKLLDLESYNTASGAYSYTVNSAWADFFKSTDAQAYMTVDEAGYATWNGDKGDSRVANFAKLALAWAQENNISPVKSSATEGEFAITGTVGVFSGLELGYYLVDSTLGALCGLTTTNPAASINAKNKQPTLDKQVKEDGTGQWGDLNRADIGEVVEFRVTIDVHAGAQNYVFHDVMSEGLTFQEVTKIEHVVPRMETHETYDVAAEYYEVVAAPAVDDAAEGEEGTEAEITDDCTFEVRFTDTFLTHLASNDKIIIHYTALLNRNAVIAGEGNPNEAWLEYGEDHETTHETTVTYTFAIDIVKTDSQNTLIDGAEFKIYDAATGGNEVEVVLTDDGTAYRRVRDDEEGVAIVVKDGIARVIGLDNGTYYLEETKAPEGYNKLTERKKFIIAGENLDAIFNLNVYSTGSGVQVVNKSGTMLPETGGIGTTLFYVIGGTLAAAALVLLITKKRMSMEG